MNIKSVQKSTDKNKESVQEVSKQGVGRLTRITGNQDFTGIHIQEMGRLL